MPPALHPRSRLTTSLFTTTLLLSFLVVGTPHILPCPADSRIYADSDPDAISQNQRGRRRQTPADCIGLERRLRDKENAENRPTQSNRETLGTGNSMATRRNLDGTRVRECLIPKPANLVERALGLSLESDSIKRKPEILVEEVGHSKRSG